MDVQLRLSQYFEGHDSQYYPCPVGKAVDGFLRQFCNRKALLRVAAIVCVLYLLYLSTGKIPEWFGVGIEVGIMGLEGQPSDGGVSGGSSGGGHSNGGESDSGGSDSQDPAPPPGGSGCSGGSSSGGDNGGDDPRKYHRPKEHKSVSEFECEEEENGDKDSGDLATGHGNLQFTPENMVTSKLQPVRPADTDHERRVNGPTLPLSNHLPPSSAHLPMFNFDRPQEPKFCPVFEKEPSVDQQTPDYQQQQEISVTSLEEEYIVSANSVTETTHSMSMNMLPFWSIIDHMSYSHPDDVPNYLLDDVHVSQESILANQVQTFTNLAQLVDVQLQVLQASGATEPFEFTLAFMFGEEHSATLVPLPPDMPFDPTLDAVIVAVPADHVLANFVVRVNPLLLQHL